MGLSSSHASKITSPRWPWVLALVLGGLFWVLPVLVFLNLGHGLDLADTGHYYNSLSRFEEIRAAPTQYFLLWHLLPTGEAILSNRLWVFGLFGLAGLVFAFGVARYFRLDFRKSPVNLALFLAVWASVYLYYFWWLPDPSYNAVAVMLLYGLSGLVLWMSAIVRQDWGGRTLYILAVLAGVLLAALAISRATTAILFLGMAAGVYGWNSKTGTARAVLTRRNLYTLGFGLAGGLLLLLVLHVFVEPLSVTIARQMAGLEMLALRGRHTDVSASLLRLLADAKTAGLIYWPWMFAVIAGAVFAALGPVSRLARGLLLILSGLGLVGLAGRFALFFRGGKLPRDVDISAWLLWLGLTLFAVALLRSVLGTRNQSRFRERAGVIMLFVLPYIFAFGTGNLWMKQSLFAGGFLLTGCLVLLVSLHRDLPKLWAGAALGALLLVPCSVWVLAQNRPYRLPKPLSGQTVTVSLRGGAGGHVSVDQATADYLNAFGRFYDRFGPEDDRAVLIDLSGMSPFLSYHLNTGLMGVPWLIATENNSQKTFEYLLSKMDRQRLKSAWIIDAPENRRHLDAQALREIGLDFPQGYEKVLSARPPLFKKNVVLYRPKSGYGGPDE